MSGLASGIATSVLLLCFFAVVAWAYSGRRKAAFERAARMPLDAENEPAIDEARS